MQCKLCNDLRDDCEICKSERKWINVKVALPCPYYSVIVWIPESMGYEDHGRVGLAAHMEDSNEWHECTMLLNDGKETFDDSVVFPTHWMNISPPLNE
jgi:hypothetical protein